MGPIGVSASDYFDETLWNKQTGEIPGMDRLELTAVDDRLESLRPLNVVM